MSGRPLRVFKFVDATGKPVADRIAQKIDAGITFRNLFDELYEGTDRSLLHVKVAPNASADSIVTCLRDDSLDETVGELDDGWVLLQQGIPLVITFVLSQPIPRIAPPP